MRLAGKSAIITGAGSGIGRATAELFAREGACVLAADYNAESGSQVAAGVRAAGGEALFTQVDVSSMEQVGRMIETVLGAFGGVDILFNGAGVLYHGTATETEERDWNRVISINLTGTFLCCKAVLPHMIARGGGSIINVSSTTGAHDACAGAVAYVASKGGVALMTKALAIDYARDNVRVNALCPGPTETPMLSLHMTPERLQAFAATFPMKRLGRPDEMAKAALFLATEDSSFVTGSMLFVDGGQTAEV